MIDYAPIIRKRKRARRIAQVLLLFVLAIGYAQAFAVAHDPMLRRAIAEDWCATNKNTQLVCWNVRGVK